MAKTENEIIERLIHVVAGFRSGAYVSRQTMVDLLADIYDFGEQAGNEPIVTPEMVREAEAHFPFLDFQHAATKNGRWEWFSKFYTNAILNPDVPCPCCNVTPAGDICDHLPEPPL